MSDLQIALGIIGLLVVAAVYAYNAWQERKLRRRLEQAFDGQREDILLKPAQAGAAARIEPRLGEADGEAAAAADGFAEPHSAAATARTSTPAGSAADANGADGLIEFSASLDSETPVGESALHELQSRIATFGKPARLLGWDESAGAWLSLGRETHGGFHRLQAAIQLANRGGPVHAPQLNGFCDAVRSWAERHGVSAAIPDADQGLKSAQALDTLCGELDVSIGLNVVAPPGSAFPGEQLADAAAEAGFSLESDGVFHWRDASGQSLFYMENHEPEPFVADRLEAMQTSGLTLLLDVPRVADAVGALDEMVRVGGLLASALGGFLVDDNRVALQPAGVERIKTQLRELHDAMASRDIPAGGPRAQRLFA
jgi:FtsZ-interacting cell division protein ZipA